LNGDNYFNSRPAFASDASLCTSDPAQYIATAYGCMNPDPGAVGAYQPIPAYLGNGPAAVAVNLRVTRAFGLGPKVEGTSRGAGSGAQGPGGPGGGPPGGGPGGPGGGPPGGGPGGGGRGGFGGGLGAGGLNGGGRGGPAAITTNRRYLLTFSAQALNLFNDIDLGTPSGNLTARNFGQSTSLSIPGVFGSSSAARRIFFQAAFTF
jgi:hypothetical protein